MAFFERSIGCGLVSDQYLHTTITLAGWVNRRRDHGGLVFIDLRDRSGIMQIVFSPEIDAQAYTQAQTLRSEYVISVTGVVVQRAEGTVNHDLPTGKFELHAQTFTVSNKAKMLPFTLEEADNLFYEETRLNYRYLDFVVLKCLNSFKLRHRYYFCHARVF